MGVFKGLSVVSIMKNPLLSQHKGAVSVLWFLRKALNLLLLLEWSRSSILERPLVLAACDPEHGPGSDGAGSLVP